jgi:NitT/TauT family transport system ATP-binding protein
MAVAVHERAGEGIRLERVSKSFRHRDLTVDALRDVDLEVGAGEFVSVVGPSGSGKSTLLRIIGGLVEPDRGTVRVGGRPAREARAEKCFGLVPQASSLLPWRSVIQNVTLLRDLGRSRRSRARPADAMQLLEAVGLADFANSRPHELSGGMQQRVSLVRAFALGAPVLLMDEPFAALDELTRETMRYQLLDIWSGTTTTVVFVTHNLAEAVVLSDRVLAMAGRPGRFVLDEPVRLRRPRHEEMEFSPELAAHVTRLRAALRHGGPPADRRGDVSG